MKKQIGYIFIALLICAFTACSGKRSGAEEQLGQKKSLEFPYIEIPLFIPDRLESASYYAEHYWDGYLTALQKDTALLQIDKEIFSKAYVGYLDMLSFLDYTLTSLSEEGGNDDVSNSIHKVLGQSHKRVFAAADSLYLAGSRSLLLRLIEMSEHYLYNPNSPFLNEELYIPALDAILNLKSLDSLHKMTYQYQKDLVMLNRRGVKAADFEFEYLWGENGEKRGRSSLYATKGEYLLIYFNNPGCASCKEIQASLSTSPAVGRLLEEGRLRVLSMYIDKDIETWRERYNNVPQSWIYARDNANQFEANDLYGIRAIPSIYLLDGNKRVILKDAGIERLMDYFNTSVPTEEKN